MSYPYEQCRSSFTVVGEAMESAAENLTAVLKERDLAPCCAPWALSGIYAFKNRLGPHKTCEVCHDT